MTGAGRWHLIGRAGTRTPRPASPTWRRSSCHSRGTASATSPSCSAPGAHRARAARIAGQPVRRGLGPQRDHAHPRRRRVGRVPRPWSTAGEDRRPTLTWPRQIPIDGEPPDVHATVKAIAQFLAYDPDPEAVHRRRARTGNDRPRAQLRPDLPQPNRGHGQGPAFRRRRTRPTRSATRSPSSSTGCRQRGERARARVSPESHPTAPPRLCAFPCQETVRARPRAGAGQPTSGDPPRQSATRTSGSFSCREPTSHWVTQRMIGHGVSPTVDLDEQEHPGPVPAATAAALLPGWLRGAHGECSCRA